MKFAIFIMGFISLVIAAVGAVRYVKSFTHEDEEHMMKTGSFLTVAIFGWLVFFALLIIQAHDGLFWF